MNNTWTRVKIEHLLDTNPTAVEKLVVNLFNRQTEFEQRDEQAVMLNNRGFNHTDAPILTSFAKQILRGRRLSDRQLTFCRARNATGKHRLGKYYRQVVEMIEAKSRAR